MKKVSFIIGLVFSFYLISCESDDKTTIHDPEFSIVFSDGNQTTIKETNIAYLDSSTGYLFLSKELNLTVGNEKPPYNFVKFSALVDNDSLFNGIVYPSTLFNNREDLYIFSRTYPTLKSDIIPIICINNGWYDTANKDRIVEALSKKDLVYQGITCAIDQVKIAPDNDSILICTMTLTNPDPVNYYVPDPGKMDILDFNFHSHIDFTNKETNEHFHLKAQYENYYWNIDNLENMSLLKGGDKLSYTWATNCGRPIPSGSYSCYYGFRVSIVDFPVSLNIPVVQDGGRIWIGYTKPRTKELTIE